MNPAPPVTRTRMVRQGRRTLSEPVDSSPRSSAESRARRCSGRCRWRKHEDPVVVGANRVQLLQELIDETPTGAAAHLAPREADRIELVDEHHAWRRHPRALEREVKILLAHPDVRVEDVLDPHVEE